MLFDQLPKRHDVQLAIRLQALGLESGDPPARKGSSSIAIPKAGEAFEPNDRQFKATEKLFERVFESS